MDESARDEASEDEGVKGRGWWRREEAMRRIGKKG